MVVPIPTEVVPVWYIEKWKKENAENGSALEHFINQLIKDWRVEEARIWRKTMTKVFISLPMKDKTKAEIFEERANIFQLAKESFPDAELIDNYFDDYNPTTGNVALKYLAKSLELLADADVAYFAPMWETARGCRIENECAFAYGIEVYQVY